MKNLLVSITILIASVILISCCCNKNCPFKKSENSRKSSVEKPGLYVENGVLIKAGKPYRGIGVNYFDLFYRVLKNTNDTSYVKSIEQLSEANIPFARFMCGGFWPVYNKLYLEDKETYFKLLDKIVETAEKNNVGLIPSLFWFYSSAADMMNERVDQLGDPDSKTIAYMKEFTRDVVTRYKNSPAIWGWEFGNEYNIKVDMPNASTHRAWVHPELGTPTNRTERDDVKLKYMLMAYDEVAKEILKHDKSRIISTGNAVPRRAAYHNTTENSWEEDTREQYNEILLRDNPDPYNVISIHVYPNKDNKYVGRAKSIEEVIKISQNFAQAAKKPLFIGEFGVHKSYCKNIKPIYNELINAIKKHDVPLAALWVYDFIGQDKERNVTFDNDRKYMLQMINEANKEK